MLSILNTLDSADTPEELCASFGEMLGLDAPVPIPVMRRALVDDLFTFHLVNCSGQEELLRVLFSDPRNQKYAGPEDAGAAEPRPAAPAPASSAPSSLGLAWRAGKAVAKWGAAGFGRVEPQVFDARFAACQSCEYLADPPSRLAYKVKLRKESDPRVCSACGCVASRKAALPTESCPVADGQNPGLNRWGEPLRRSAGR